MPQSLSRYSIVAILLHWSIALLIAANIVLAWVFQNIAPGMTEFKVVQLHKSVGITILGLSLLRLVWRLFNPPPPQPAAPKWQRQLSQLVHWSFYGIMIGMPISGWIMVSVSPINLPTLLFGVVPWPHIAPLHALAPEARKAWSAGAERAHLILSWLAYMLICLHAAAALKHQFLDQDNLLYRMAPLPGRPSVPEPPHAT